MNFEDRLRNELNHSGSAANVGAAPSVDELASVADGRHRRNRIVGAGGALVLAGGVLFGAFTLAQPGGDTVELASGDTESSEQASIEQGAAAEAEADADAVVANEGAEFESDDPVEVDAQSAESNVEPEAAEVEEASAASTDDQASEVVAEPSALERNAVQLQANGQMTIETRESAVGIGSGSGVLVQPSGSGYVGLAVAFGNDTTAVSLASDNGLDWTSAVPEGIPVGATASVLREHNGSYVALFERFNAESGVKEFFIGTSSDTIAWDVSAPLPGGEIFATDLAVGAPGVIVIGDNTSPQVWTGPVGGPYALTGQLDATLVDGVTTVGDEFVVAGRSADAGVAVFTSVDAVDWAVASLSDEGAAGQSVSARNGALTLRSIEGVGSTLISRDAGETWSALPVATNSGIAVSTSTMGFIGVDGAAVMAVTDDVTFTTAQLDVAAPDRLAVVASSANELVLVQTTEAGTTWIVARR